MLHPELCRLGYTTVYGDDPGFMTQDGTHRAAKEPGKCSLLCRQGWQRKRERLDGWRDDLADTLASFAFTSSQHSFVNLNFIPAVDLSFQCDSGFT